MACSARILSTFANMILHTGVPHEIVHDIDPHDTLTPKDIFKVINGSAHEWSVDSRDTNHEAKADTETARAIFMTGHAHKIVLSRR